MPRPAPRWSPGLSKKLRHASRECSEACRAWTWSVGTPEAGRRPGEPGFASPARLTTLCQGRSRRKDSVHGARLDATAPRRGRQGRLRRRGVQRQQHGADPGDHGGGARDAVARDHPGLARSTVVHERPVPLAPDAGRERALPRDPALPAPRPRQRAGDVHLRDRPRVHERDDGRVARGRRQDAGLVRLQRRGHEGGRRVRPCPRRHRRGRDRHARRDRGRPRLGRGAPDRSGRGGRVRRADRRSTRSPSRSGRRTARTSSRRSRTARC